MGLLVVVALSGLTTWGGQSLVHAQDTDPAGEDTSGRSGDQPGPQGDAPPEPSPVQDIVRKYQGQIAWCYETQLKQDPTLAGRVVMEFSVHEGRSRGVQVFDNDTGSEALGQCFVDKIETWRWPAHLELEGVVYPFVFAPEPQSPAPSPEASPASEALAPRARPTTPELQLELTAGRSPHTPPSPARPPTSPSAETPRCPSCWPWARP